MPSKTIDRLAPHVEDIGPAALADPAEKPSKTYSEAIAEARKTGQKYQPTTTPREESDTPRESVKLGTLINFEDVDVPTFTLTSARIATAMHLLDEAFELHTPPDYATQHLGKGPIGEVIGEKLSECIDAFFRSLTTIEVDFTVAASAAAIEAAERAWDELQTERDSRKALELWSDFRAALSTAGTLATMPYRPRNKPERVDALKQQWEDRAAAEKTGFDSVGFYRYVAKSYRWWLPSDNPHAEPQPDRQKIDEELASPGRWSKDWTHPRDTEQVATLKAAALNRRFAVIARLMRKAATV